MIVFVYCNIIRILKKLVIKWEENVFIYWNDRDVFVFFWCDCDFVFGDDGCSLWFFKCLIVFYDFCVIIFVEGWNMIVDYISYYVFFFVYILYIGCVFEVFFLFIFIFVYLY